MEQILNGTAMTLHAIQGRIQGFQKNLVKFTQRYGINLKTIRKRQKREPIEDIKCAISPVRIAS